AILWTVELVARLNNRGYINWLKAGRCLLVLKEGLHPFIDKCIRDFHGDLLNQKPQLRNPCQASCKPKGKNVSSLCKDCTEWTTAILEHHKLSEGNTRHVNLNWDNCVPPSWRTDHWELAKAYMPRGQVSVKGAAQCDASALLYLIINCDNFPNVDEKSVKEVIQFRNELMHSSELNVTDEWMRRYQNSLKKLLQQFNNVPEIETVKQQIDEVSMFACVSVVVH
uniref:DZIP3-like HEPN domain-containing protein n=1 Tax=Anabas testudineus TaxID=64144 RepID=A0A7N6B4V2_ANATE